MSLRSGVGRPSSSSSLAVQHQQRHLNVRCVEIVSKRKGLDRKRGLLLSSTSAVSPVARDGRVSSCASASSALFGCHGETTLASRPFRRGRSRSSVVVFGKSKDGVEKEVKQLKKIIDRAENNLEKLLKETREQTQQLEALSFVIQEEVSALKREREAFAELVKSQLNNPASAALVANNSANSSGSDSKTSFEFSLNLQKKAEKDAFESSKDVADDILGAIAKVGFPDSYGKDQAAAAPAALAAAVIDEVAEESSASSSAPPPVIEPEPTEDEPITSEREAMLSKLPSITVGCDDIQVMALLHAKLEERGYYCTDDEREDWYFGDSTQNAVLSFQSSNGLTENGSVTRKEWEILLENEESFDWKVMDEEDVVLTELSAPSTIDNTATAAQPKLPQHSDPVATEKKMPQGGSVSSSSTGMVDVGDFPMLREGDGGRHVRLLQLALDKKGRTQTAGLACGPLTK